jgi:hypothetical protein
VSWAIAAVLGLLHVLAEHGLRVGPWQASDPPAWVQATALAALLIATRRASGPRAGLMATVLGAACLAGLLAHLEPRVPLGSVEARLVGPDGSEVDRRHLPLSALASRHALGRGASLDLEVRAAFRVTRGGTHAFQASCDPGCVVDVDGRPVAQEEVRLEEGVHDLHVRHARRLTLDWDTPAAVEVLSLGEHLAARREEVPDEAALRAASARVLHGALIELAAWMAASLALLVLLGGRVPALAASAGSTAAAWLRAARQDPALRAAATVAGFAWLVVVALTAAARARQGGEMYLHRWTSEYMMQTVSVADLRDEPLRSLVYNHIQPPAFDAVRALLARSVPAAASDAELMRAVDRGLYRTWAVVHALLAGLVALYLARLTTPRWGLATGLVFAVLPGPLFYATFLDGTMPSALGVLWLLYELWRVVDGRGGGGRLAAATIVLFLARSVVQWAFLAVLAVSLVVARVPRPVIRRALLPTAVVIVLFLAKQYALFGVTLTSTFGPDSFCKGLSEYCLGTTPVPVPPMVDPRAATVLRRAQKLNGEYNYNQAAFLRRSFSQMAEYKLLLRERGVVRLLGDLVVNARIWLRPTSTHSPHALVDRLPWRRAADVVLSGAVLVLLLGASVAVALRTAGWRRTLAVGLPALYVAAVTIAFESGENMRYRYFLEPAMVVLVAVQASRAQRLLTSRTVPQ